MIVQTTASSSDIFAIIDKAAPAFNNVPRGTAIIATLTMVSNLMRPEITPAELQSTVQDASKWFCSYFDKLDGLETPDVDVILGDIPKNKMN